MGQEWFVAKGSEKVGPFSVKNLKERAQDGRLRPGDLVWAAGMSKWKEARLVKGLFLAPKPDSVLPAPPVAIPVAQPAAGPEAKPAGFLKKAGSNKWVGIGISLLLLIGIVGQIVKISSRSSSTTASQEKTAANADPVPTSGGQAARWKGGDPSVDFAKLDWTKINYDAGPQGQEIRPAWEYHPAPTARSKHRLYFGQDGNEYKHGIQQGFDEINGILRLDYEANFVYGIQHGREHATNLNGQPYHDCTWDKGLQEGRDAMWLIRKGPSIKMWEHNYVSGELDGEQIDYDIQGRVWKRSYYKKGKLHGTETQYGPDGKKMSETEWENGVKKQEQWFP